MASLDPRINRLNFGSQSNDNTKEPLDQLPTFEVFLRKSEKRPMEHVGIVHGADEEIAFLFAKEQFSRRYTCTEMWIVRTNNVYVSPFTEGSSSIYDQFDVVEGNEKDEYCVFHLLKRGKQHIFAGMVLADSVNYALSKAKEKFSENTAFNVWVVKSVDIHKWSDATIWETLPDKGFREALAYKAGDKLKDFLKEK